jgi:hypothetical protein
MRLYKIHTIAYSRDREKQYVGITIPDEIAQFFPGCHFKIQKMTIKGKVGIFCESGCPIKPTKEEIEKYDFQEIKV